MKIVEPKYEILTDISEGGQDHAGWGVGKETGGLSGEAGA